MSHIDSRQMSSTLLRLAIHLGQPLASQPPSVQWFKFLVDAVCDISGSEVVRVYFAPKEHQLMLRASWEAGSSVEMLRQLATDPNALEAYRNQTVVFSDNLTTVIHLPIRHETETIGVLSISELDETASTYIVLEALDVLISFAACGFAHKQADFPQEYDPSQLVERTRSKALNELSAAVAHQLNNPLTTILADTEILLLDTDTQAQSYGSLLAIARAGKRAAAVARRLMSVSKPDKLEGTPQPTSVVRTLEDVLQLVERYLERDGITLVKSYPQEKLPPVWVAPDVLGDVWLNVLMNAREALHGQPDGQIEIEVSHHVEESKIYVNIKDNGVGLPQVAEETLFKPFFTLKASAEHMGLGLHISQQIVQHLGGTITAANRDDTHGARLTVCLPIPKGP